jgi:DNA-binding response OmpR family regulator
MINGDNKSARILVVDDIPDTLELLSNWLEVQGFKTIQARNGQQAIDMASIHKPDLILLDVMMPKMDGIETCRQLKAKPQTANIPVILVTAKDPSDARADGMMAGAVDYITKPINLQDLTIRVEAALSTDYAAPVDVQRLLAEVAHTALAVLGSAMVWLLGIDEGDHALVSQTLASHASRSTMRRIPFALACSHAKQQLTHQQNALKIYLPRGHCLKPLSNFILTTSRLYL